MKLKFNIYTACIYVTQPHKSNRRYPFPFSFFMKQKNVCNPGRSHFLKSGLSEFKNSPCLQDIHVEHVMILPDQSVVCSNFTPLFTIGSPQLRWYNKWQLISDYPQLLTMITQKRTSRIESGQAVTCSGSIIGHIICWLHITQHLWPNIVCNAPPSMSLSSTWYLWCVYGQFPTSESAFLLYPIQGPEPEEANLPANSLLRPLWPIRVYMGGAQKACPLNTPAAWPDWFTLRLNKMPLCGLQLPPLTTDRAFFLIGRTKVKFMDKSALKRWEDNYMQERM